VTDELSCDSRGGVFLKISEKIGHDQRTKKPSASSTPALASARRSGRCINSFLQLSEFGRQSFHF
jgi:hypothetical protein